MNHIGLFEGIGGFSLAARWMGWETIAWCEWNPFCQKVLNYHFPKAKQHGDITTTDFTIYRGQCDILTGGFPCQDISSSGKGAGINGSRSGLWKEYKRAIEEVNCKYIVAENSPNLTNKGLETILLDLSEMGFCVEWGCIPASKFGAWHKRERIWIVAYPNSYGFQGILQGLREGDKILPKPSGKIVIHTLPKSFEQLGDYKRIRESNGVPNQLDRIKSLGNAIVPQVALQIFKAIQEFNKQHHETANT